MELFRHPGNPRHTNAVGHRMSNRQRKVCGEFFVGMEAIMKIAASQQQQNRQKSDFRPN